MLQIINNEGVITNIINVCDAKKRLPKEFELRKMSQKKGAVPCILLFKTPECDAKSSFWLEDWGSLVSRAWVRNGWSVVPVQASVDETVFKNTFKGGRRNRAQCLLEMSENDRAKFMLLDATKQIGYLEVPNATQAQFRRPDFGLEQLMKYARFAADAKERREREKMEAALKEEEAHKKKMAAFFRERRLNSDDTFGEMDMSDGLHILTGDANMRYLVKREGRDFFETFGAVICEAFDAAIENREVDSRIFNTAEEKISAPVKIPLRLKLTGNEATKADRLVKKITEVVNQLNHDVRHRIWFYYALKYVREDKVLGFNSRWSEISQRSWP
jgi:hypothetical protein